MTMTFLWPSLLATLILVPVLVVGYRRILSRRSGRRAELARLGLVSTAVRADRWRHLPAVLFLIAVSLLLVGLARPQTTVADPRREGTVILAFDTSASMVATDIGPTRLGAAKAAARSFVEQQPESIKVGVVTFDSLGVVVQQPTTDKNATLAAIDRLAPRGGTAVGAGIRTALSAIAGKPIVVEDPAAGPDIGFYGGTAVIMLTDGENTERPDPLAMADLASVAGVRIYPIGLGSPAGTVIDVDGYKIATALDEAMLTEIAEVTDGTYYSAADAASLSRVYQTISLSWTARSSEHEVTSWFALAAALLVLAGAGFSVLRTGRVW
jgi:Ca-activated chloride channel family protein